MASPRATWREPPSPAVHHWDELAALARRLMRQRAAGDPQAVAAGNLSEVQATTRARVMKAIARLFTTAESRDIPRALGASAQEMHSELRTMAQRTREAEARTGPAPGDEDLTTALDAMAWHCLPWPAEQSHLEVMLRNRQGPGGWLLERNG